MSDARLRRLEQAWRESGLDADVEAYALELERIGDERGARRARGRWGRRATGYHARGILSLLDRSYAFPALDEPGFHLAGVRLSAWRDLSRWALIVELVGFEAANDSIRSLLCCFGNCLLNAGREAFLATTLDAGWGPDHDGGGELPLACDRVLLRGQPTPLPRAPAWFAARGVTLSDPPEIRLEELTRALAQAHPERLFSAPADLRALLAPAPAEFLRLDEWTHPDVGAGQVPSQSESFRLLARALEAGDPDLYQPTQPPNTHWSNWPEGGSL